MVEFRVMACGAWRVVWCGTQPESFCVMRLPRDCPYDGTVLSCRDPGDKDCKRTFSREVLD